MAAQRLDARRPDYRFAGIVAFAFFATLVPRLLLHVFWRDELEAWMIATDGRPSFATLLHRVGYEAHPALWHVMLWLIGKVWPDPVAMKCLHAVIATAIVFVIAACAPASRMMRVLICTGYFLAFEYSVVSRNYGLGTLGIIAFTAVRTSRPTALVTQAACLALATQANVHALLLAVVLAGWAAVQWLRDGRPTPRRFVLAVAIVACGVGLTGLQLIGPPDRDNSVIAAFGPPSKQVATAVGGMWRSFVPVPAIIRDWWNSNILETAIDVANDDVVFAVAGLAIAVLATWALPARRGARWLWLAGAVVLVGFSMFGYSGTLRHHGHLFILFIVAWWLSRGGADGAEPACRPRRAVVLGVFMVQAIAGVVASVADVLLPFSASAAVARYLEKNFPQATIIGEYDFTVSPIASLLGRPIFYIRADRWGTYVRWDHERAGRNVRWEMFSEVAARLAQERPDRPVVVVLSAGSMEAPDFRYFRKLATFDDSSIHLEKYLVYRFDDAAYAARIEPR